MPTDDFREAAQIIRGLKQRVDRLEERGASADVSNVVRRAPEITATTDTVAVDVDTDPGWVWDASEWDFDQWEPL